MNESKMIDWPPVRLALATGWISVGSLWMTGDLLGMARRAQENGLG